MPFKELKNMQDTLRSMFGQDTFREMERSRRMLEEATQGLVPLQSQQYLFQEDMDRLRNQIRDLDMGITFAANENIRKEIELRSEMFSSLVAASEIAQKDIVKAIAHVAGDNINQLDRFFQGSIFENIKSNFDYFVGQSDVEQAMQSLRDFQQSFGYEYAQYAERMATAEEEEDKSQIIQEFIGAIDRLWERMNKTKPMTLFIINLLFTFMIYCHQNYEDDQRFEEQRVFFEQKIVEFTETAQACNQDSEPERDKYTVKLQAKVYDGASFESQVLVILNEHMSVFLEDIDGDWYYVNYVDQIKAVEGLGWVHKDYVIKNLEE